MGRHISRKSPLIRLDSSVARSPASLLGTPPPTWSLGPGWDKGHTVSPGGEGGELGVEKGGSVGRTRPHSAQGLAVPGRLARPCGCHTRPGPGSHDCWPAWVLAGLAAASRAQSSALRGPSKDLECLEPCPPARCLCAVPWGAARATSRAAWCPSCSSAQIPFQARGSPKDIGPAIYCLHLPGGRM